MLFLYHKVLCIPYKSIPYKYMYHALIYIRHIDFVKPVQFIQYLFVRCLSVMDCRSNCRVMFHFVPLLQTHLQDNSSDCGIFVLQYIENLFKVLRPHPPCISQYTLYQEYVIRESIERRLPPYKHSVQSNVTGT